MLLTKTERTTPFRQICSYRYSYQGRPPGLSIGRPPRRRARRRKDNYGREALAYLPTLQISYDDAVVQVFDEQAGEVVYTLRIKGRSFRPKVFRDGTYTVRVGEGKKVKVWKGVASGAADDGRVLAAARE